MRTSLFFAALCLMCGAAEAIVCASGVPVRVYHWIVCEISSTSKYSSVTQDDSYYLLDGLADGCNLPSGCDCGVVEGMRLEVRCEEPDHVLYRNGSSLGQRQVEWTFAVAEEVEGDYDCRRPNGSVFGSRHVAVEGDATARYCTGSSAALSVPATTHQVDRTLFLRQTEAVLPSRNAYRSLQT